MPGGPQRGSGRHPLTERYWIRSLPVNTMFRPMEFDDLQVIARGLAGKVDEDRRRRPSVLRAVVDAGEHD